MNIVIKNGYIVTPIDETFKVEKKNLYIKDGVLSFEQNFDKIDKELDLNGKVVMPGLVNAHHHIYSVLSKGIPAAGPFKDFNGTLEKLWWKLDRVLTKEDMVASTKIAMQESIKSGVSTVFDHHISVPFIEGSLDTMGKEFERYGVNGVLCFETSDRNGEEIFDRSLKENIDFAEKHKNSKYLKGTIGMHASFTLGEKSFEKISKLSKNHPIHIHVAEDQADVDKTEEISGLKIVERLNKYGLLRENSLIVHGNRLNDKELDMLKDKKLFVIHNPDSNMNNTLVIKNISETLGKGLDLTVGTDGMTSGMLRSFKNSFLLNRYLNQDPDTSYPEMLKVLSTSYKLKSAYNFDIGVFEGDEVDIAIFDYQPSTPFNNNTFLGHFIFGITESRVQYLLKNGEFLLNNYQLKIEEEEEFFEKTSKNTEKLFERFLEQ